MQWLAAVVLLFSVVGRADDANSIILRSLDRDWANFERLKNYTYEERSETREYDKRGKPAWVIEAQPKPGYRPKQSKAKVLEKVRAKIRVDQAEYQWVKVEAEAL